MLSDYGWCRGGCPQPQSNVTLHPLSAREDLRSARGGPSSARGDTRLYNLFLGV